MLRQIVKASSLSKECTFPHAWRSNSTAGPSLCRCIAIDAATSMETYPASQLERSSKQFTRRPRRRTVSNMTAINDASPPSRRHSSIGRGKSRGDEAGRFKRLRPQELSLRIQDLCKHVQMSEAIDLLKKSPADAQNTGTWNTLIGEMMKAGRYKIAWETYVDMKRRGMRPNVITSMTLLKGWSKITDWAQHTKQLQHCHTVWEDYQQWIADFKAGNVSDDHSYASPLPLYIRILATNGLHDKITEILYQADEKGRFALDQHSFSALFYAIYSQSNTDPSGDLAVAAQRASDAKLLWRQMLAAREKKEFPIDSWTITPVLHVLSKGRPNDQALAFDIMRDHMGLARPGETAAAVQPGLSALTHLSSAAALKICNASQKPRLCIHFFDQLMRNHTSLLGKVHITQALVAYVALANPGSPVEPHQTIELLKWSLQQTALGELPVRELPDSYGYNSALHVCQRGGDWPSALEVFYLMTGYQGSDFSDANAENMVHRSLKRHWRSQGTFWDPDLHTMTYLLRTAWGTHNRAHMRQGLRMVEYFDNVSKQKTGASYVPIWSKRLAEEIIPVIDHVLSNRDSVKDSEGRRWMDMKKQAEETLKMNAHIGRNQSKREAAGFAHHLDMMEEAVDFEMASRHT